MNDEEADLKFGSKIDDEAANAFIEALARGDSPTKAAKAAQKARHYFYYWRNRDEEFKAAWADAYEQGLDLLEDEARRRAVEGVGTPVYGNKDPETGERQLLYTKVEYSDQLLITLLKAGRPTKYRDSFRAELSDPDGSAIGTNAFREAMEKITTAMDAIHEGYKKEAEEAEKEKDA